MTEHKPFHELVSKMPLESQEKIREEVVKTLSEIAAQEALDAIHSRSFSGRHPELGKMINCQYCSLRHRENERRCEQNFIVELQPPEGLTQLTARQILGAKFFERRRQRPRNRPKSKTTYWQRVLIEAHKRKYDKKV